MKENKVIKAVAPYIHSDGINFKTKAFEAWEKVGGSVAKAHYPYRLFHYFAFNYEIPLILLKKTETRLRFVQPASIKFDTFPDYLQYEIIPFVWDCWPCYFEETCRWLQKYRVRTAIFTSSQTAKRIQKKYPEMNILSITEGIDTNIYAKGKELAERKVDILNFGRPNSNILLPAITKKWNCIYTIDKGKRVFTSSVFRSVLEDTRLTIALPRSISQPEVAGDIETLTQRYWENMLSRIVMVGHAPKELTDLIGYNPVIEIDMANSSEQITDIQQHITDYQSLVDRNRETAMRMGDWTIRMRQVMDWLKGLGYEI